MIEQSDNFLSIIAHGYNTNLKKIIENENISTIILSFKVNYNTNQSYIVISNGKQEEWIETPKIPMFIMESNMIAIMAANTQRTIDSWFVTLKEILEWQILTTYCREINVEIKDTCFYGINMFFTDHIVNEDDNIFIAHPYIIQNYPEEYGKIKQTKYLNNSYKEMDYNDYIKKHQQFVKEHYIGWN